MPLIRAGKFEAKTGWMRTSLPFKDFTPKRFLKKRFAPLVATVLDDSVDSFMKECGFRYSDFLAALGASLDPPVRVTGCVFEQTNFAKFEAKLIKDLTDFASMFLTEEFEKTGNVDKTQCDFPTFVHPPVEFGPGLTPWYHGFLFRSLESLMYADFGFCDLPCCILYATRSGVIPVREVRKRLVTPPWMRDFVFELPVICVFVQDGLAGSRAQVCTDAVTGYARVIATSIRSRVVDDGTGLDQRSLEAMFGLDGNVMKSSNLGRFIGPEDVANASMVLSELHEFVSQVNDQKEKELAMNVGKQKVKKRWGLFKGSDMNERKYSGVSSHKVDLLRHAVVCMSLEMYQEAQRKFRLFAESLDFNELTNAKFRALFYACLCLLVEPSSSVADFVLNMEELVLRNLEKIPCHRTALVIPLLTAEMLAILGEKEKAVETLLSTGRRLSSLWPSTTRLDVQAMINERLSAFFMGTKHVALYLARASVQYQSDYLQGHLLRVLIWLMKLLPVDVWQVLRQQVWLAKIVTLQKLNYTERSLQSCLDLLSLPDVCPSLQEEILSRFWYPFNSREFVLQPCDSQMKELVDIKNVRLVTCCMPEYYGFPPKEFSVLIRNYDKWYGAVNQSASISFAEFWRSHEIREASNETAYVPCGTEVQIFVGVVNRFVFVVHLDECSLRVAYHGQDVPNLVVSKVSHLEIPPKTKKANRICYSVRPLAEGLYTVTHVEKDYWGYVKIATQIQPVSFVATKSFPSVTMTISNLPDTVFQDSYQEIFLVIENTGMCEVSEFRVALDHPELFLYRGPFAKKVTGKVIILTVSESLKPGEHISIPFILMVPSVDQISFCGFVGVLSHKTAYVFKEIRAIAAIRSDTNVYARMDDSGDSIVRCDVTALVDGVEVSGIYDGDGRKLRMLSFIQNPVLMAGESVPVVAFLANPEESSKIERWRATKGYSLMYRIQNNALLSQTRLDVTSITNDVRLVTDMPQQVSGQVGDVVSCQVVLKSRKPMYIEPIPFVFLDSQMTKINGCRFVGKTRVCLSEINDFRATLSFAISTGGIYQFIGFRISESPDFTECKTVSLSMRICVSVTE